MVKRLKIFIEGIVQGVGFRPHVYNLARSLDLTGYVLNDSRGVTIEVEGPRSRLEEFKERLLSDPPPLAVIQGVKERFSSRIVGYDDFVIKHSKDSGEKSVLISPDIATCEDCLREVYDPADPRYLYPFINCTNCGPRFTIITDVPYDRKNTSMAKFPMCSLCKSEYEDPSNRRFHAQPVACPRCGPRVFLYDKNKNPVCDKPEKVIPEASNLLKQGKILAVKGLGGYHLSADALDEQAVLTLRKRKYREDKPFAVMVPDMDTLGRFCKLSKDDERLLTSFQRPIVILEKTEDCPVAPQVAPNNNYLGVMLPYTPLHRLLLDCFGGALVMTSGNMSEEPISYRNESAFEKLGDIADYFLTNDRPIHTRCDDSVVRTFRGHNYPIRRSRGYAPYPIIMTKSAPTPVLAVGGELKNTFCIYRKNQAILSHHIGDLENPAALESFEEGIEHFCNLFDTRPEVAAYDPHPRYFSTNYALNLPVEKKYPVYHHHAHAVSVMADRQIDGEAVGVILDGVGYGADGKLWGCEFLRVDYGVFDRIIRMKYIQLPGGEKAIREPWRTAVSFLMETVGKELFSFEIPLLKEIERKKIEFVIKMLETGIGCVPISSAGRFFDAVSSILGIRQVCNYEGQAAIEMEMIADSKVTGGYPLKITKNSLPLVIDPSDTILSILNDLEKRTPIPEVAGKFHNTVVDMVVRGARIVSENCGSRKVVLGGGVFQNMILLEKSVDKLEKSGFKVYTHRRVPTNDGGISLGQAAAAAHMMREGIEPEKYLMEVENRVPGSAGKVD